MDTVATLGIFLLAGFVKGTVGLGLPLVSVALLTPLHGLPTAMAVMLVPAILTNVWQAAHGPGLGALAHRLRPMLAVLALTAGAAGVLLSNVGGHMAEAGLGIALLVYVALVLTPLDLTVPPDQEPYWAPATGALTGIVVGATGVLSIPSVIYLRAIGLERDHLVQAMGLTFAVALLALTLALAVTGTLAAAALTTSVAGLPPALLGMAAGSALRRRVPARAFQRLLLAVLGAVGVDLILGPVLG